MDGRVCECAHPGGAMEISTFAHCMHALDTLEVYKICVVNYIHFCFPSILFTPSKCSANKMLHGHVNTCQENDKSLSPS
jgi:hypothetical protein